MSTLINPFWNTSLEQSKEHAFLIIFASIIFQIPSLYTLKRVQCYIMLLIKVDTTYPINLKYHFQKQRIPKPNLQGIKKYDFS